MGPHSCFFFIFILYTFFFHFHQWGMVFMGLGATLPNHIPACSLEIGFPNSSRWQILFAPAGNPCTPLDNFKITRICQEEYRDMQVELMGFASQMTRICQLELTGVAEGIGYFFAQNCGRLQGFHQNENPKH